MRGENWGVACAGEKLVLARLVEKAGGGVNEGVSKSRVILAGEDWGRI